MAVRIVSLGEVLRHRKGSITIDDSIDYKLCRVQVHRRGVVLRQIQKGVEIRTKKQQVCRTGDFIVAEMDAKVGGYGFISAELDGAIVSSHYYLFEINEKRLIPDYLYVLTQTDYIQNQIKATGSTNYASIRSHEVLGLTIPLPSIEQQHIIVKQYQIAKEKAEIISAEFQTQQTLLTQLRQSILQEAVQGKLTQKFRETERSEQADNVRVLDSNPSRTTTPKPETGADLLARIRAEKAELIQQGKLRKEKPLLPLIDAEKPFELPKNWVWCRLGEIAWLITDGTHQTPSYTHSGRIFLSAQNIKPFRFMPENHKYVSEEDYQDYIRNKKPEKNDVLIARVGAGIGEAAVINHEIEFAFYVSLGLVKLAASAVIPEFFVLFMNSPTGVRYAKVNTASKGGSAGNFNLERIRNMPVPLPPINEQQSIITHVERLLGQLSDLEKENKHQQVEIGQLMQAVLREAFAGKEEVLES
ncbi:restriction endonuclease subunit S [Spirosoma jeollabukense]